MAPPPLVEELEEEVLLRFPPQEPALLVRAALVCKRWRRIVSGPGFRRRFRELHRTPPMLGFLCNISEYTSMVGFVTTAAFCSPDANLGSYRALDARHGRVLLQRRRGSSREAVTVWDPITDEKLEVPIPLLQPYTFSWTAAVVCAAIGRCNHLDCHRGPFLLVFVGSGSGEAFISTYSSDAGTWSKMITTVQPYDHVNLVPSVLVGNALYFGFPIRKMLLKYDLGSHEMSVIGVPAAFPLWWHIVLDDGLGLATIDKFKLFIWRNAGPEVDAGCRWTQNRVIELETLLPSKAISTWRQPFVLGFSDGIGVVFLQAGLTLFTIDLKTCKVKKVCEGRYIYSVVPYMSFYTPALGSSVCASGA